MARVVTYDGEEYSFKNGEWISLHGSPANPALRASLYETYLNLHYTESKAAAAHLPYSEALSVADELYAEMDGARRSYSWPNGARKDHYYLRELAAEVSAYYAVALDKYFDVAPRLMFDLRRILCRLSSSLRVIPKPELCRELVLGYMDKAPAAVGEELLTSVIAACSDMFKNSGGADLDSLEAGIDYFADACMRAKYKPSVMVKRAIRRLYNYAIESNAQSEVVDEFIRRVADWERCGFFANC